jgi:hypothetical protein
VGGRLRDPEPGRDILIGALFQDPCPQRGALVAGQVLEQGRHGLVAAERRHAGEILVGPFNRGNPEPSLGAALDMAATLGVGDLVGRDAQQPRLRGPLVGPVPAPGDERRGEDLGAMSAASSGSPVRRAQKVSTRSR